MRKHNRDRGRKQAIDSARKMKVKGFVVEDIAEITGLTIGEINKL